MKFSVLLPTRNRLDLLRLAIETVRRQDYGDWEIVVADNASTEDACSYVASLGDPRIRCSRIDSAVSVTENWNRSLSLSRGDYVVMLGDDDGLLPGYFRRNLQVIETFEEPDLLFVQGVQFVYGGAMPGRETSFIQVANCEFLDHQTAPFVLSRATAAAMVRKSLRFQVAFPYNMQYWLFSRSLVKRLLHAGPFFQSPYPDYYAANVMLLEAQQVVVQPVPLVAVGISKKSFGYYYFNKKEPEGVSFLMNDMPIDEAVRPTVLPGSNMNTSWLLAMEALRRNWGDRHRLAVARWRYRYLQFRVLYSGRESLRQFFSLLIRHARPGEVAVWCLLMALNAVRSLGHPLQSARARLRFILDSVHRAYPDVEIYSQEVSDPDLLQFSERFDPDKFMRTYNAVMSKR